MSKQESVNKLNGRDFINIGIYTAIYFVLVMVLAMTGLIPIFLVLLSSMIGIIGGIPFMLFLTKVKKPGMILIMSTIMGILMFVTGMTWMPIPFSIVTGLIAEFIYFSGKYKSMRSAILTAGIFPLWACGNYLPLFLQREQYFASRTREQAEKGEARLVGIAGANAEILVDELKLSVENAVGVVHALGRPGRPGGEDDGRQIDNLSFQPLRNIGFNKENVEKEIEKEELKKNIKLSEKEKERIIEKEKIRAQLELEWANE